MQLVCAEILVLRGYRGGLIMYNNTEVFNKFRITPQQYLDYLALVGDPSDNIKGVKGVGKKRAISLLLEYGSITKMYKSFDLLSPTLKKLLQNKEEDLKQRKDFLKINSKLKLNTGFNTKKYLLSKKSIPDKMGEFLTTHWEKII